MKPTRICAWCQAVLAVGTFPATHGICPTCFARECPKALKPEPETDRDRQEGGKSAAAKGFGVSNP